MIRVTIIAPDDLKGRIIAFAATLKRDNGDSRIKVQVKQQAAIAPVVPLAPGVPMAAGSRCFCCGLPLTTGIVSAIDGQDYCAPQAGVPSCEPRPLAVDAVVNSRAKVVYRVVAPGSCAPGTRREQVRQYLLRNPGATRAQVAAGLNIGGKAAEGTLHNLQTQGIVGSFEIGSAR